MSSGAASLGGGALYLDVPMWASVHVSVLYMCVCVHVCPCNVIYI